MRPLTAFITSRQTYLPLLLGILFILSISLILSIGTVKYYSLDRTLTQWDGQHYKSIAQNGYMIEPCPPGFPPGFICGNVGWFPLYPHLAGLFSFLPFSTGWLILIFNWLLFLITLVMIFRLLVKIYNEKTALLSIIALLLFPTSFYLIAGFPYTLFFFLSVLLFQLIYEQRFTYVWFWSALLSVTYPSGIIILIPLLGYTFTQRNHLTQKHFRLLLLSVITPVVSLILYAAYYWYAFDNFYLYLDFQSQSGFDHTLSFPFYILLKQLTVSPLIFWQDLQTLLHAPINRYLLELNYVPVTLFILYLLLGLPLVISKKIPLHWHLLLWGILLFTPTMGTADCYYRHVVIAWPIFILLGGQTDQPIRKYYTIAYLILSVTLALFVYLPLYKIGQLM